MIKLAEKTIDDKDYDVFGEVFEKEKYFNPVKNYKTI